MILSLIIPCYNSALYIKDTLELLISQGLDDMEVVLINDGSTDSTLNIIESYRSRIENLKVINQRNQGVSVARNNGLKEATGKFVYFLDSDDSLTEGSLDFFRTLLNSHGECKMVAFDYQISHDGTMGKVYTSSSIKEGRLDNRDFTRAFFTKELYILICSTIYNREYLISNGIEFSKGHKIGEDHEFIIESIVRGADCYYIPSVRFIYQINDTGASRGYRSYVHSETLIYQKDIFKRYGRSEYDKYYNYWLAYNYVYQLRNYILRGVPDAKVIQYFKQNKNLINKKMTFNIKFAIICTVLRIMPLNIVEHLHIFTSGENIVPSEVSQTEQ